MQITAKFVYVKKVFMMKDIFQIIILITPLQIILWLKLNGLVKLSLLCFQHGIQLILTHNYGFDYGCDLFPSKQKTNKIIKSTIFY